MSTSSKNSKVSTGITCRTWCERVLRCAYYREREDYLKGARLLFERVLKRYSSNGKTLIEVFGSEFSHRSYTGVRRIFTKDREFFRSFCVRCAINLDKLFQKYKVTNIMEPYNFRWKIKGYIHGVAVPRATNSYNLWLSFKNANLTQKDLDMAEINSYIYNQATGQQNPCMVMSVPTDAFFLMPYNERDYTIQRGFANLAKTTKLKRHGEHCMTCQHHCNPLFYKGLERLELIV